MMPQRSETFTAIQAISKANRLLEPSQEWKRKMELLSSPLSKQTAAFKLFHEQSSSIAKLLNPSLFDFLQKNVRTSYSYEDLENVSILEAAYLETFEGIENEVNSELQNDVSATIAANPKWKSTLWSIAEAVKKDRLETNLSLLIGDMIIKGLKTKKPAVVRLFMIMVVLLISHVPTAVESYNDAEESMTNRRKNETQNRKINKLEAGNRKLDRIKNDKETLHNSLNKSILDYKEKLLLEFKEQTIRKYTLVAATFIDYLHSHTDHTDVKQVTKVDVENFIADVQFDRLNSLRDTEIRSKIIHFLRFIKEDN